MPRVTSGGDHVSHVLLPRQARLVSFAGLARRMAMACFQSQHRSLRTGQESRRLMRLLVRDNVENAKPLGRPPPPSWPFLCYEPHCFRSSRILSVSSSASVPVHDDIASSMFHCVFKTCVRALRRLSPTLPSILPTNSAISLDLLRPLSRTASKTKE